MFFCENCQIANGWPTGFMTSRGKCECCGKIADCFDVPSGVLSRVKTSAPPTTCPKCGCQTADPFAGKTIIHDVEHCGGLMKRPQTQ